MLLDFIKNGLVSGILYSLMAIGFALVYNTTKIFHIAAAAFYVFAAYMFYWFVDYFNWPIILAACFAIVLTMGLSLLTDVSIYRPLNRRKASNNVAMIASIGVMTVIVNVLIICFKSGTKMIDSSISSLVGNTTITEREMWLFVAGCIAIALFLVFIWKTPWGMRFRALSADNILYETMGYNTSRTRTLVFLMSGAFIAIGSCLRAYDIGFDPHMGMDVLINALVAMILGGVGRFGTCVLGGVTLGLVQALTDKWFPLNWEDAITFVLLLLLLFVRPQGIAGYKQRTV